MSGDDIERETMEQGMTQDGKDLPPLCESVRIAVQRYFDDMDGHLPEDLYKTVLKEIERPLLEVAMNELNNNQSKAAIVLGLNRTTLRKKLQQHGLD